MEKTKGRSNRWARASALLSGLAAGLIVVSPTAVEAGAGDLDPTFASQGLYVRTTGGGVLGIDLLDGDYVLLGGGLVDRLLPNGTVQTSFPYSWSFQVFDFAVQPDGRIVAVGQKPDIDFYRYFDAVVLRLNASGSATEYLEIGVLPQSRNTSVLLSVDGRIVVAGIRANSLTVQRFMPDGSLDLSFATGGRFVDTTHGGLRPVIVAVPGGYRVLAQQRATDLPRCQVLALTEDGHVDTSYGEAGYTQPAAQFEASTCTSIAALPDGRIEIVGQADDEAFAVRLTAGGVVDAGFKAPALTGALRTAERVVVDADGNSVIAGASADGEAGLRIVRLRADGSLDGLFGDAGTAWVDLQSALLSDMVLLPSRAILLAGATLASDRTYKGFAARLLGDTGAGGPGVLGFKWSRVDVTQQSTSAILTVRRTGGASGPASVSYRTRALGAQPLVDPMVPATAGSDYFDATGLLLWTDGDTSERVVRVQLGTDETAVEDLEGFEVELFDATGAAVGTRIATVAIAADGSPSGFLALESQELSVSESEGFVSIGVSRKYYGTGAISVTLIPKSATALAGSDFDSSPVTLNWADGELGTKYASIPVSSDNVQEPTETFTVELADATGQAVIGNASRATATILDDDAIGAPSNGGSGGSGGGGGGRLDGLLLALLIVGFVRRWAFNHRTSNRRES